MRMLSKLSEGQCLFCGTGIKINKFDLENESDTIRYSCMICSSLKTNQMIEVSGDVMSSSYCMNKLNNENDTIVKNQIINKIQMSFDGIVKIKMNDF